MTEGPTRVLIKVTAGPATGKTVEVVPGRPLLIGRLPECGVNIASDGYISRRHCQIDFTPPACRLTNMSSNRTFLNGQNVEQSDLNDGDLIEIGSNTIIEVSFAAAADTATAGEMAATARKHGAAVVAGTDHASIHYTEGRFESPLRVYCGRRPEPPVAAVAGRLEQLAPLHLIAELNKIDPALLQAAERPEYLLNWLPENALAENSPAILTKADEIDLFELIEQGWGKDALICVYAADESSQLWDHFRRYAGAFVRPSILTAQLFANSATLLENLLTGIHFILLESEHSEHWTLLAVADLSEKLEEIGFVRATSETTVSDHSQTS